MAHSSPPRKRSRGGGGSSRETTSTAIAIEDDRDESRERALSLELESSSDDDGEEEDEDEEEEEGEEEKEGPRRENAEERKRNGAGSSGGRNGESKSIGAGASATSTNDVLKTVARHTTSVLQKAWAVEKACDVALRLKRHNTRLRVRHAGVRRQRMQLVLRVITEAAKPLPVGALKAGAAPDSAPRFEQHILLSAEKAEGASSPDPEVNDAQETTVDVTDAVKTIVVRYMCGSRVGQSLDMDWQRPAHRIRINVNPLQETVAPVLRVPPAHHPAASSASSAGAGASSGAVTSPASAPDISNGLDGAAAYASTANDQVIPKEYIEFKVGLQNGTTQHFEASQLLASFLSIGFGRRFADSNPIREPVLVTYDEVLECLWTYVRHHGLHDDYDETLLNCDATLQQLFGMQSLPLRELEGALRRHLGPVTSVLTFKIPLDKVTAEAAAKMTAEAARVATSSGDDHANDTGPSAETSTVSLSSPSGAGGAARHETKWHVDFIRVVPTAEAQLANSIIRRLNQFDDQAVYTDLVLQYRRERAIAQKPQKPTATPAKVTAPAPTPRGRASRRSRSVAPSVVASAPAAEGGGNVSSDEDDGNEAWFRTDPLPSKVQDAEALESAQRRYMATHHGRARIADTAAAINRKVRDLTFLRLCLEQERQRHANTKRKAEAPKAERPKPPAVLRLVETMESDLAGLRETVTPTLDNDSEFRRPWVAPTASTLEAAFETKKVERAQAAALVRARRAAEQQLREQAVADAAARRAEAEAAAAEEALAALLDGPTLDQHSFNDLFPP